ncbi:MAG: hypothetical protein ABR969_04390 [Sedimentisphaerales bacterium]|jgi:hypothetical protein
MVSNKNKKQVPFEPTDIELKGSPQAFLYELKMLHSSVQHCVKLCNNFTLETALLHARNLFEFFTGKHPQKGDLNEDNICAGYFVEKYHKDEKNWWKSSKLQYTQSRIKDINKCLGHLTFSRIEGKYQWNDLPQIMDEIETAYIEFLQMLPEEDRAKWTL